MSGFKGSTWKKWKANKTTSPVAVTDKKSIESISSQRSSSLLRSRKRRTKQDTVDDVGFFRLAAENRGKPIPKPLVDCGENKLVTTDIEDHYDAEHKDDFRDNTTSPFNTLAPTNQFCRENTIIVQYGNLEDGKANSPTDSLKSHELWGELPSTDVAASPKPEREKGPKGGTKRPASPRQSRSKKSGHPATPTNEKSQHPTTPHPDSGPSVSHHPPPHCGQPQRLRTSPSSNPANVLCDLPECPVRGPKQKERLCMAPECPVTMKKAVVKEAKRAMKKSCRKKRKNPLTILGAVLMSAFTGNGSTCKLTKEEKKALKRMKAEEDGDDSGNSCGRTHQKSVGVQCKAPVPKNNDQSQKRPSKADKSTSCDIPECPIVKQKSKIKEFMDKGQLCDIPSCPVKKPPPQIEKKVEPPKGCPAKPCTLKAKDEAFLKTLGPCIYEKIPRLKMTCEEAHAGGNGGRSRPHHAQPAIKHEDKPAADKAKGKAKDKDKGVKIVTAHVRVPPPTENPFQATITNPLELLDSSESPDREPDDHIVSVDKESECQKLGNRQLSAPGFISRVKADEIKCNKSTAANLRQKKKLVIRSEGGNTSKRSSRIRFSVHHKDSPRMTGTPENNHPSKSCTAKFVAKKFVDVMSEESLLDHENGSKSAQSNFLYTSADDPIMTHVISGQTTKDHTVKKFPTLVSGAEKARSKDMEMHPFDPIILARHGNAKVEGMAEGFQASKSYSLIKKSAHNIQKSDFPLDLEDKWRVVTVLPVKYPSAYSATSNHVLKDPLDLRTPKETSIIKSLHRNPNNIQNSKTSLADEINSLLSTCWKTNNKTEDIGNILKEDSTNENSQQRFICNHENLAVENTSSFKFSERINGPLLVGQKPAKATILPQKRKPGSDYEHCLSKIKSKTESSTRILHESSEAKCSFETTEPSRKIQFKKPRVCQSEEDAKKLQKENTSKTVKTDERTYKTSSSEKSHFGLTSRKPITENRGSTAHRLDNSEASNGTCTQTLATSAISPINVNTIGVGSTSIIGLGSQHLIFR